jgi:hypothetical protein
MELACRIERHAVKPFLFRSLTVEIESLRSAPG